MDDITTNLENFGLSKKEIDVYTKLLSLGTATATTLSKTTGLVRTTVYDILKSLKEKGMVSSITKNKIMFFQAMNPETLLQILDEKREKIRTIIPELKKLNLNISEMPLVELYDGKEGIKSIYQDILLDKQPLYAFSNTHYIFNVLPFFVPNFINNRVNNNIPINLLNEDTKESRALMKQKDELELRETRFIPELKNIALTEYIYGNKVAIFNTNPQDPYGMIIRSKDFARMQKLLFDILWKQAKK